MQVLLKSISTLIEEIDNLQLTTEQKKKIQSSLANVKSVIKDRAIPSLVASGIVDNSVVKQSVEGELIYRAIFSSWSTIPTTNLHQMSEGDRVRNGANGITGIYVHKDRNIIQLLEGQQDQVQSLLEKIELDKRHTHFTLLYAAPNQPRMFSQYFNGCHDHNREAYSKLMSILRGLKVIQYAVENLDYGVKPMPIPHRIVRYTAG
jgi:hypothetical protein